jgi:hypothetical protein
MTKELSELVVVASVPLSPGSEFESFRVHAVVYFYPSASRLTGGTRVR